MPKGNKRHLEVRLLVMALIDITNPELAEALRGEPRQPSSVAEVVAHAVISHLEAASYVETAIVSHL